MGTKLGGKTLQKQWEKRQTKDVPTLAGGHQLVDISLLLKAAAPGAQAPSQHEVMWGLCMGSDSWAHPPALHQPLSTSPSFGANVLMRIIIIITCTDICIKLPDPREVSSDCHRKKTFSLCGLWLGARGAAAPHSGTNYRGAEPSAEVSLIPGVRSLSNAITWGGWQVSGVPSVMHFGLGQVGDVYSWQHCAATQLGKEEFLLINAMMYDTLAAQTL